MMFDKINDGYILRRDEAFGKLHTEEIASLSAQIKPLAPYVLGEEIHYRTLSAIARIGQQAEREDYPSLVTAVMKVQSVEAFADILDIEGMHKHNRGSLTETCAIILEREKMVDADNAYAHECPFLNTYVPQNADVELQEAAKYCLKQMPKYDVLRLHSAAVVIPAIQTLLSASERDRLRSRISSIIQDELSVIEAELTKDAPDRRILRTSKARVTHLTQLTDIFDAEGHEEEDLTR